MLTKQKDLHAQKVKLLKDLEISLVIQRFIPDIFNSGTIKARWQGNLYKPHTWVVTDGGGNIHSFSESEVPIEVYRTLPQMRINLLTAQHRLRKEY